MLFHHIPFEKFVRTTYLERPVLHVILNASIVELATDETLGIEDGVVGVHGDLVLGGISDETLRVGEGDIRRRRAVS